MAKVTEHLVAFHCACGSVHHISVQHYDRVIVSCGRPYWALQPKRNGPLRMFPWPGSNLTRQEYREKYPNEE
jgi:hypothetical protein